MEEWKSYKLGDISTIQTGPFGSQLHQSDYVESGVPCIMPTNIGRMLDFQVAGIAHISEGDALKLSRHIVHEGDIVYSRRGDIEKCAYVSQEQDGWFCGTGCLKITINSNLAVPKFVAYYLSTDEIKSWIVGNAVGTTMLNLNTSVLADVPLSLPSIQMQKRCVQILDSIENKIALNNRINHNLEEQAQALYKSWFVDFEPFKDSKYVDSELGMVPEGWHVGVIGDIATITSGKRPNMKYETSSANHSVPVIGASSVMAYTDSVYLSEHAIITGRVGTLGIIQRINEPCWPSDNTLIIKSKFQNFLYQVLNDVDYSSLNRGSTQPLLTQSDLKSWRIIIPPIELITEFESAIKDKIRLIADLNRQNRKLSLLREILLPQLMLGSLTC